MINLNWNTPECFSMEAEELESAYRRLCRKEGEGNDFLGWMDVDNIASDTLLTSIQQEADRLKACSSYVVVAGIGGSYLGARAVIEALSPVFPEGDGVRVLYAGNSLSEDYMSELLHFLDHVEYSIIVISKSGTTTETAVSFRLLRQHCEQKYGAAAAERIVCITDRAKGALKAMATQRGYPSYVLPENVGGRYSVLTPVGLLPIAVAGADIRSLVRGAADMKAEIERGGISHQAVQYACFRNTQFRKGVSVEVMAVFEPRLQYFVEWWKQLFGESEGKQHKGLFPAGVVYTTDLHSMGQYMQDGSRIMMETFLWVRQPKHSCKVPYDPENLDQLNYLQGENLHSINEKAFQGTVLAHEDGAVPSVSVLLDRLDAYHMGQCIYFFEFACALSGYLLGVNPFDQPGVEAYKKNMFALLGKKGYEQESEKLKQRLTEKK